VKSEDARLESIADPAQYGDLNENDPQSVARFVKRMGTEMGEDLGEDLDAAMDEARSESPTEEAGGADESLADATGGGLDEG